MERARSQRLRMPPLEDGNSIQVGLMEIQRGLLDHHITSKDAGLLLYSLQIATANLKNVTFHKNADDMVLEQTQANTTEKAVPDDKPGRYEKYRYETIDPDLREKLMEIGDEVDRRMRERAAGPAHVFPTPAREDENRACRGPQLEAGVARAFLAEGTPASP
jgi:hypothetical protein